MIPVTRQTRYVSQPIPIRLGGLATNLARLASVAETSVVAAIASLLDESRAFIEWSAPALLPERVEDAARLVDIQRGLTRWYWKWHHVQHDPAQRCQLAEQAQRWADEILQMSGLLEQE